MFCCNIFVTFFKNDRKIRSFWKIQMQQKFTKSSLCFKTCSIQFLTLYFCLCLDLNATKQQKINKILHFHPNFLKNWKKMLTNSGFYFKNVSKNPDFCVVKNRKKWKSWQNRGVSKIEGWQNRGSTVYTRFIYYF